MILLAARARQHRQRQVHRQRRQLQTDGVGTTPPLAAAAQIQDAIEQTATLPFGSSMLVPREARTESPSAAGESSDKFLLPGMLSFDAALPLELLFPTIDIGTPRRGG